MTTLETADALAKQLSAAERAELAKRWLAEACVEPDALSELDALIAGVGTVVSGRRNGDAPAGDDPLWALGADPVDCGVTDASLPAQEDGGEDPIDMLGRKPRVHWSQRRGRCPRPVPLWVSACVK
jgi:hypothetical protein